MLKPELEELEQLAEPIAPEPDGVLFRHGDAPTDALDQHKERLIVIIESEETTPDDKYEALMRLASLTGVLTELAAEDQRQFYLF